MMPCEIPKPIEEYMQQVETGSIQACEEQHLLVKYIRNAFGQEDIHVDEQQLDHYLRQAAYFPYDEVFPWEKFVLGLHCCTYRADGLPRWPDLFLLIGRGAGKDGFIAYESWCLVSPYNGIKAYDVDICANSELQAKAPFEDIWGVLETPALTKRLKKHFYWNKESIVGLKTNSRIKYRTNNPKGKDGLRSGIVVFNEIHQYENYDNINVFTTGLGKKPHPRRLYATTDGDVRDGPLDHYKERSAEILKGGMPDNGWLPFICKLDSRKEINDPAKWEKANPSLPYSISLREEMLKEYNDWKLAPSQFTAFPTKRMNIPEGNADIQVTSWENIKATNQPVPMLAGHQCIGAIDYAKVNDFASAGLLFRIGDIRYWITHSWLCSQSADLPRMKCPWREWEKQGFLTVVDDIEIKPSLIADWFAMMAIHYHIIHMALDNFRYALISKSLAKIGFSWKDRKNVKLVRPSDIMIVSPVIDSAFTNHQIVYGDNPVMRWATNNTKMIRTGINRDTGNMTYGKIEPRSRKTDPFMAFVAAMTCEDRLVETGTAGDMSTLGVWTF
jgi:phage terminase large subunit-like protein